MTRQPFPGRERFAEVAPVGEAVVHALDAIAVPIRCVIAHRLQVGKPAGVAKAGFPGGLKSVSSASLRNCEASSTGPVGGHAKRFRDTPDPPACSK